MLIFLAGAILGVFINFPIGIIGLYIFNTTLKHGKIRATILALLVSVVDGAFPLLVLTGYSLVIKNQLAIIIFQLVSIVLLIFLVIHPFKKKINIKPKNNTITILVDIIFIFTSYILNPATPLFWLGFSGVLVQKIPSLNIFINQVIFVSGVGIGSFLIIFALIEFVDRKKENQIFTKKMEIIKNIFAGIIMSVIIINIITEFIKYFSK